MLRDETMFNVPVSDIGRAASNLTVYTIPFAMLALCFVSYMFELLGRRLTLAGSYFITSIVIFFVPYTAPSYTNLMIARCLIGIFMAAPIAHPLVADYVHKNSRGKMIALTGMGIIIGEILAISIFKVQMMMKQTYYTSFAQVAFMIFILAICFLFAIKDPSQIKQFSSQIEQEAAIMKEKKTLYYKVSKFNYLVRKQLNEQPLLLVTLVGASITRLLAVLFSTYLLLWIQSFT